MDPGADRQLDADAGRQLGRPGAGGEDHRIGTDVALAGSHPHHRIALHQDGLDARGLPNRGAEAPGGGQQRSRRPGGIRVAGLGLVGRHLDVVGDHLGRDAGHVLGGHQEGRDAEFRLHAHVRSQPVAQLGWHQLEEPGPGESAIAADDVGPVAEDLQRPPCQRRAVAGPGPERARHSPGAACPG